MIVYEKIEWTNTWVEEQGRRDKKRVLLVGDSITNGSRAKVKAALGEDVLLDALTTAHALDNPAFRTELDYFLGLNPYDTIHFNNGLHGWHLPTDQYEALYNETVRHLREACPGTRLILALTTPVTKRGDPDEPDERNLFVLERNEAARRIAAHWDLPVNDLYSAVCGQPGLRAADGYHYNDAGYTLIGKAIAAAVSG